MPPTCTYLIYKILSKDFVKAHLWALIGLNSNPQSILSHDLQRKFKSKIFAHIQN